MKNDSQIASETATKSHYLHILTDNESANLKRMLLIMYNDIASVCRKHKLTFMLGGGSCLGAVRHNGFIPWDDDLDLMMPRESYDNFIKVCEQGELGEQYEFNTPSKETDCKNVFLKIYRKGTLDNELYNENTPFPRGIFIDIFPMDSAPKSIIFQKIKSLISDSLLFISTSVLYAEYPSYKFKKHMSANPSQKRRYELRLFIGNILKFIPHRLWVYWFDKFNSSSDKTGYITIPSGRKHYYGEIQPIETFLPVSYGLFEGVKCPLPNDPNTYLTSLYDNYMTLPPENKRERHCVYQFKCELPK